MALFLLILGVAGLGGLLLLYRVAYQTGYEDGHQNTWRRLNGPELPPIHANREGGQ